MKTRADYEALIQRFRDFDPDVDIHWIIAEILLDLLEELRATRQDAPKQRP